MKRIPFGSVLFLLFVVSLVVLIGLLCVQYVIARGGGGQLQVSFLDVGQGDAILIQSPSGTEVLIDGGRGREVLRPLGRVLGYFDRDIDVVLATHPDSDHIGGLIPVLERYRVGRILMTENVNDTPAYDTFMKRVEEEGAEVVFVRRGMVFDLGVGEAGSTTLSILFPDHDPTNLESNTSSVVSLLTYGETQVLLTGDSPSSIEGYLVSRGARALAADVLKLGHHGSQTSSSQVFLEAVTPDYGIVSAGKDNSYGHPHKEVVDRLESLGITMKNTADLGSIFLVSDGRSFWFR
jgi:competence protein ComEC